MSDDSQNLSGVLSSKTVKSALQIRSEKKGVNNDLEDVTSNNSDDENAIDSERDEPETGDTNINSQASLVRKSVKQYCYSAYEPFRELVDSDLFRHMCLYGN
jgi:hypothetical protein